MNKKLIKSKFLDLYEGRLEAQEAAILEQEIAQDAELSQQYSEYQRLVELEKSVQSERIELSPNFSVKVMQKLEASSDNFIRRGVMKLFGVRTFAYGGLATAAVVVLAMKLMLGQASDSSTLSTLNKNSESQQVKVTPQELPKPKTEPKPEQAQVAANVAIEAKKENFQPQPAREEGGKGKLRDKDSKVELDSLRLSGSESKQVQVEVASPPMPGGVHVMQDMYMPQVIEPYGAVQNTERYNAAAEGERIEVKQQPVSTFSIDVDTGSYTNTRRFLRLGQLPPTDSVRVEEFLNYFNYSYPKQYNEPFALHYEVAPSPLENDRYFLKLGLKTKDIAESTKPWNLVFLIDVSGSMMDESKLSLVKQSLKILANKIRPSDKLSIVTYAGNAGVVLEGLSADKKSEIAAKIDALEAGGSTYGSGGILEAYRLAQKYFIAEGENRVILATDGDFNVGVTNDQELIKLIEDKRKEQHITLTTLGVGTGNYNEAMLEQIANKGNGNYFYLDSFKEARRIFETQLLSTIETIAKDVKIQVEFNPEQVSHYRLIGYSNRRLKNEDFNNDAIDAGEVGAGHTVTAIYEVVFANSELAKKLSTEARYAGNRPVKQATATAVTSELAFVKLRYKEPKGSESKLMSFPITQSKTDPSIDFRFAASVAYFGQKLAGSNYASSYDLQAIAKMARESKGEDLDGSRAEFVELVETAASITKK